MTRVIPVRVKRYSGIIISNVRMNYIFVCCINIISLYFNLLNLFIVY